MHITDQTRKQILLQNIFYYALLIAVFGLLAWLSVTYTFQSDWSANNRNTLQESSQTVLEQLTEPVEVMAFIAQDEVSRNAIKELISRYQRYKSDLTLTFVNPETNPAQARALGVTSAGELFIEYQGRQERLQQLSEQTFTNALQRLMRAEDRWFVFLEGHGERNPLGQANHDLSEFSRRLSDKGIKVQTLSLLEQTQIPDNTAVLVIASPRTQYLPGEVKLIQEYIQNGGNLLWLLEPDGLQGSQALATQLGIRLLPGTIVDAATQMFGIEQPDFALVLEYSPTPITESFAQFTLFPQAAGIEYLKELDKLGFSQRPFLQTLPRSWTETGLIGSGQSRVEFNPNTEERLGPITLGIMLNRTLTAEQAVTQQRVVVLGDGDFLSNAFLGNGGNLELGLNIINWLSSDDNLIAIKPLSAPDTQLQLSRAQVIAIALCFMLLLPLGFIITGVLIWLRRRKR